MLHQLTSPRGETLTGIPWDQYPRPRMRREAWLNLNGAWDFSAGTPEFSGRTIQVPFCPESALSGIQEHFEEGTALWYRRKVTLPEGFRRDRVLLHIGAADQTADVYVNRKHIRRHEGGYTAFTLDITDFLQEENQLAIRCYDNLKDQCFPYGKQVLPEKRGGMWYTPVSGIWQTVWMESVPEIYIQDLVIENQGTGVVIDTGLDLPGTVTVAGLGVFPLEHGRVFIQPETPHFWSPEDPYLYEAVVEVEEDRVETYFAIRTLEIKEIGGYKRLCLNGKPYFFHGLLNQGYWPEGLLTPPAPECYADDILAMKKLGFNTLRKHIKIEPDAFYYQCDKLGMVVFQDLVNNGPYRFPLDTALVTVLPMTQTWGFHRREAPEVETEFQREMEAAVKQLKSYPCICYWTIFNEGWGQFDSDRVCEAFRKLDSSRFIDATSGWFRGRNTDVDSRHVYFRKLNLRGKDKPLVLSEFGGYSYKVEGHVFNSGKSYGYGTCETREAFSQKVEDLYRQQVLPHVEKGLCAAIYTQVSDVEDEINGLLTYDRKVEKLTPEVMVPIAAALGKAVEE